MSRPPHLPTLFGRATLVSDGHTTLKDAADALRTLMGRAERDAPTQSELLAAFDGFAEQVLAHFAIEEGGSYRGSRLMTPEGKERR